MKKTVILLLLFFSCQKHKIKLADINLQYIYEKIQVLETESLSENESKMIVIQKEKLQVETKIIYNSKGNAIEFFVGGSEGFILYSRDTIKGKLPFDKEKQNIKISINKKGNYIFDNNDTIKEFEIIENEKLIKSKKRTDGRIVFYRYK